MLRDRDLSVGNWLDRPTKCSPFISDEDWPCQTVAGWSNGSTLDRLGGALDGETDASDHGLSAIVDIGSKAGRVERRRKS